jgi:hypothetical protein
VNASKEFRRFLGLFALMGGVMVLGACATASVAVSRDHLVAGAVVGPGLVSAERPGFTVYPASRWRSLSIPASNAYRLYTYAAGRGVVLEAVSRFSRVEYVAPSEAKSPSIVADFGPVGRIDMTFYPTDHPARTSEPQGDCRGRKAMVQKGLFVGHLMWRGERGFSQANEERAPGMAVRSFREVCEGTNAGRSDPSPVEPVVTVVGKSQGRQIRLTVVAGSTSRALVTAQISEVAGDLRIARTVTSETKGSFDSDHVHGELDFRLSSAFSGFASFSGSTWSGTLAADFPGLGRVSLTGPAFMVVSSGGSAS